MMINGRYFANVTPERQLASEQSFTCPEMDGPIRWDEADHQLQTAKIKLRTGGYIFLTVERLGDSSWDWLVWDKNHRMIPRYGIADNNAAARHLAELTLVDLMLAELDSFLVEVTVPGRRDTKGLPEPCDTEN